MPGAVAVVVCVLFPVKANHFKNTKLLLFFSNNNKKQTKPVTDQIKITFIMVSWSKGRLFCSKVFAFVSLKVFG